MSKHALSHYMNAAFAPDWTQWCKFLAVSALIIAFFWLPEAQAGPATLPVGEVTIPGVDANEKNWLKQFVGIIILIIVITSLTGLGFGLSDTIFSLFRTANDARQNGDWGPTIRLFGMIVGVVVFCLLLYFLLNKVVLEPLGKLFG